MAATIQKILKPTKYRAVDTSGNNNHGQIYSGRALEFDGVSDYYNISEILGTSYFNDGSEWTWTAWMYWTGITTTRIVGRDNTTHPNIGMKSASGSLYFEFRDANAKYYRSSSILNSVIQNTWTRWVVVSDGVNIKFYLNGELFHTISDGDASTDSTAFTTTKMFFNGWGGPYESGGRNNLLDGKMSDGQLWDAAWSASDVTYDYLNPESLALNNSGTSLTESNLKLWYSMQDGHRGQQSYIMDGANTGLSDNLVTNPTCDANLSSSSTGPELGWQHNGSGDSIMANGKMTIKGSGGSSQIKIDGLLTVGLTYKITLDVTARAGAAKIEGSGGTNAIQIDTSGSQTFYYTTDTANLRFNRVGSSCDIDIDNVYVYPVNDKHHATTVFFGDEMISAVNDRNSVFDEAGQWSAYNGTTVDVNSTVSGKMHITFEGDGTFQGAQLPVANFTTPVAGRIYRIEADLDYISGADTDIKIKFCIAGTNDATCIVSAVDGTPNDGGITTTEERYFSEVIATNSTGELLVVCKTAENDNASDPALITVDNVTVKEIGVASGWTDADQQLDIPQTALQSYNQLAMPHGKSTSHVAYSDGDSDLKFTTENHSFSFWICPQSDNNAYVFSKGAYQTSGYYVYWGGSTMKLQYQTHQSSANQTNALDNALTAGKWYHAVVAISDSGTKSQWYINGEPENLNSSHTASTADTRNFQIYNRGAGSNNPDFGLTELSVFNKTLTQSEAIELYNDGKALDARTHSASNNLLHYWRNNGLGTWTDIGNAGSLFNGTPTNIEETLLLPAGVDASRCTQGFYMNRQKNTNSLNLPDESSGVRGSSDSGPYVFVPKAPIPSATSTVTNFSFAVWLKLTTKLSDIMTSGAVRVFDDSLTNANRGLRVQINQNNIIYTYVNWGSSSQDSIYTDFDLDNLDNATVTNPHSFGTDGEWNGTQNSMGGVGINQYSDGSTGSNFENEWIHYAVTFDHDREESQTSSTGDHTSNGATNITNRAPFYSFINGIIIGKEGKEVDDNQATATDRAIQAGNNPMLIGNDMNTAGTGPGSNGGTFPGEIDDLLFYNKTLTARDILRIYNAGKRSHR